MPAAPADPTVERKLAAIFAADIAGYSRLMGADEAGTFARLKSCRELIDRLIAEHRGRIFNTAGDSIVADFASAVGAVQCAVAVQAAISTEEAGRADGEPMRFRIGIHVGDVIVDGGNLIATGSTSPPAWRRSPNPARSAFRARRATRSATSCR
jgi:adenylate cyclase